MRRHGDTLASPALGSVDETLAGTSGAGPRRDEALARGDVVGRYIVIEPLGRGSMGIVYKAFDPHLDRAVALKVLGTPGSASTKGRLMKEAQAIAKVSHPNVVAVHDVGTHEDEVFFAMELVDGSTLGTWLSRESPGVEAILDVFGQAGAGLAAAHQAGIVHRDFKPDNVLVDADRRVRVLDFGLARRGATAPAAHPEQAEPGRPAGTPAYMSPEQFGDGVADARSDQFSFCVALHEALTGDRPFHGDTYASLAYAVLQAERVKADYGRIPPHVLAAIDRGLEQDPGARFESMDALLDALTQRMGRSRGPWALGGGLVVLAAIGVAYGIGRSTAMEGTVTPCADATKRLEPAWNDGRRAAIDDAFARSGVSTAEATAPRVLAALDDYSARWRRAAELSCRMIQVDRTLDYTLSQRSKACIDRAWDAFERQLDALDDDLDARHVDASLDAVAGLPAPQTCVDEGALVLDVEYPIDRELRAAVWDLRETMDDAIGHYNEGRPESCLDVLTPLEARVRQVGHGPTLARVLQLRADCEFGAGLDAQGRQTLQRAFETSLEFGHDRLAVQNAASIAHVFATRTNDFDRADAWVRRGEALARRHRLGNEDATRALLNVKGIIAGRRGRSEEAIAVFEELADVCGDDPAAAPEGLAATINIGVVMANAGNPQGARTRFEEGLEFATSYWGPEHPRTGSVQAKLAQSQFLLGNVDEAYRLQRAVVDMPGYGRSTGLTRANGLELLAKIEMLRGNSEQALGYARDSYNVRVEIGADEAYEAATTIVDLANLELKSGNPQEAKKLAGRVLELLRDGERREVFLTAQSVLAAAHIAAGEVDEGRRVLRRAEQLVLGDGPVSKEPAGYRIGTQLLELGELERANRVFAVAERATLAREQAWNWASLRLRYVESLLDAGRTQEAFALLGTVEASLKTHPLPPSAVDEAAALRKRLGATPPPDPEDRPH